MLDEVLRAIERDPAARRPGGRNNIAVRAVFDGHPVFAKRYFRHPGDPRNRLATEFTVLSFLWRHGIRQIPEPIAIDEAEGIGVYELVAGEPLAGQADLADAMQLADFLVEMFALRAEPEAERLPKASDAAFSLIDYVARLQERMNRVRGGASAARRFVEEEAAPALESLRAWLSRRAPELGVDADAPTRLRTLSPGDIGLHNALRRPNGSLAFVDFEYGGWDDAAHVIASACLPPGVPVPEEAHLPVLRSLIDRFDGDPRLSARVRLVYPLLALKWSLILLNELIDVDRERRRFAGSLEDDTLARIDRARAEVRRALTSIEPDSFLEELLH